MITPDPRSQVDQIQAILADLRSRLIDLPVEYQGQVEPDVQKLGEILHPHPPGSQEKQPDLSAREPLAPPALQAVKEALAASEARYRELADTFTDPFTAFDTNLRLVFRNQAAAELTHIPDEEAVGKTFPELYPFLVGGEIHQAYWRAIETNEPQSILTEVVRPSDGEKLYIDVRVYPTRNGVISFSKDITERRQAEEAYRKSQQKIQEILESVYDSFFEVDRAWRFTYMNRQSAQLAGAEPKQLIGKSIWEVYPGLVGTPLDAVYHQVMAERRPAHIETQGIFTQTWYDTRVYPSGDGITVYSVDITERKRAELEQRRLELESIQLHTEMTVQHRLSEYHEQERQEIAKGLQDGPLQDLSTLIFGVQCAKEASQETTTQAALSAIRASLETSVRHLSSVINELRPPSLIQSGVIKAMHLYTIDFLEKHPDLRVDLDLNPLEGEIHLSEPVNLAFYRIYQEALNNIVRHAQASNAWVRFEQVEDQARMEVRDNGRGFSLSEGLIEQTRKNHFGLAGMKERAGAVGGELQISSAPGQGTVIRVTIPIPIPDPRSQ